MTKYNRTIASVIITPDYITDSPLYAEKVIIVTLTDEAGGPFVVLTTGDDISGKGELRLDVEELEEAAKVARELIGQETLSGSKVASSESSTLTMPTATYCSSMIS